MPDSIIIFICTFDLFGKGKLCYTFENTCVELPGLRLSDGAVKMFLNTQGKDPSGQNPLLAEFLRYAVDENAPVESPEVKRIKQRVEETKRSQEMEARYMTSLTYVREVYEDGREDGREEGKREGLAAGMKKGSRLMNELNRRLIQDGRTEDLFRSIQDTEYQKELMEEYGLDE